MDSLNAGLFTKYEEKIPSSSKSLTPDELSDLLVGSHQISVNTSIPKVETSILSELEHPVYHKPITVGIVKASTRNEGSNVHGIANSILETVLSGDHHIVIAPEYSFLHESGPLSVDEVNHYISKFNVASKNGTLIIPGTFVSQNNGEMRNTSYVFYNGEIIFEYDKIFNGGEIEMAEMHDLKHVFGDIHGKFPWEGLEMGIEICSDGGTLKRKAKDRDLLFLISCGNECLSYSMGAVKKGGYGIVVDGFLGLTSTKYQRS